jgi:hypothetical protein
VIKRFTSVASTIFTLLAICLWTHAQKDIVLVSGNPPLTQRMVDQYVSVCEYILEFKLDKERRVRFEQATVKYWTDDDRKQIGVFLDTLKLYGKPDELKRIRDSNQQGVIDALRADKDSPDSVVLVEAYDAAHPDRKNQAGANDIARIVGTWKRVDFLNADRNPTTGRLQGVSFTDSRVLEISSDGNFKYLWTHNHCNNGSGYGSRSCCHQTASHREGTVSIEGVNLVFQMAPGLDLYKDECDHSQDKQSRTEAARVSYPAQTGPSNGKVYLCWDEPGQKKICLEKQ